MNESNFHNNFATTTKTSFLHLMSTLINTFATYRSNKQLPTSTQPDENHLNSIRSGISNILRSEINKPDKNTRQFSWIPKALKQLRTDPSIIICPADKGNATVVMNKKDYVDKIDILLQDTSYKTLDSNPTTELEDMIQTKCQSIKNMKHFNQAEYDFLVPTHTRTPKFYGLPKIHKKDVPLRPITDFRFSPSYNLATYLGAALKT